MEPTMMSGTSSNKQIISLLALFFGLLAGYISGSYQILNIPYLSKPQSQVDNLIFTERQAVIQGAVVKKINTDSIELENQTHTETFLLAKNLNIINAFGDQEASSSSGIAILTPGTKVTATLILTNNQYQVSNLIYFKNK